MAAFMADYELFQIEITRTYGKNEWRDDIRKLFRKSGVEGNDAHGENVSISHADLRIFQAKAPSFSSTIHKL